VPQVVTFDDMYAALDGCDGLIICTEWSEFRQPDFQEMGNRLNGKVIFDGRNIYRRRQMAELGFAYYSVGRPPTPGAVSTASTAPIT
jgi:UDPglucose 6-dehydrogenase